jgi:nephrocystin-4
MQLQPKEPFMLAANAVQELHVGVRAAQHGAKFLTINVVDIETHQLIRSWLVCVSCRRPMVSKSFELMLPVGGGKGSNKKISFTNPYPHRKTFNVHTNRDDLLQFKETRLDLGAGEQTNIGLRFAPSMSTGAIEILVFINDEDDKNEETFSVRATYQ